VQTSTINTSENITKKRRYNTQKIRNHHVEAWRESGLSIREYCKQNNLANSTLATWLQIEKLSKQQVFKPISITQSSVATKQSTIEIIIDQKIKVRLFDVVNPTFIVNLIKELMTCN
jgi:hypothetical protein